MSPWLCNLLLRNTLMHFVARFNDLLTLIGHHEVS